jgi:hypothetical protein
MEVAIIGIATFFNLIILKFKLEHGRVADFMLDVFALIALSYTFGGSIKGLEVAMIASALMSLTLLFFPPKMTQ